MRLISHLIKSRKRHLPELALPNLHELALPELVQPEPAQPEPTLPEIAQPERAQPELALPEPILPDFDKRNRSRNKLKITNVEFSNFPEACPVCHLHQCEQDFRHTIYWTVFETLEECLAKPEKKPPDEERSS